jgi:hypothetical protein
VLNAAKEAKIQNTIPKFSPGKKISVKAISKG